MFNNEIENIPQAEKLIDSEIYLRFRRHAKKENDPDKKNDELLLTPQGRKDAMAAGKEIKAQVETSVAGGSQMQRSQEAALLLMLANQEEIQETDSLDNMKDKIKQNFKVGTKIFEDKRLGFISKGEVGEKADKAYENGRYSEWLINDSDAQAKEFKDTENTTYSRQAGDIAEIFEKYEQAGRNFHKLVNKKDDYEKFGNRLERYLGTHAGTGEAFIAKVLEIQEGEEAKQSFAQNNKAGWKELTGMDVKIKNYGLEQIITVTYPDGKGQKTIEIKPETIKQMILDKEIFNEQFRS